MVDINKWLEKLKTAEKTCLVQDGKRKVHFVFQEGTNKIEMAEEYNMNSGQILVRKWRKRSTLGGLLPWEYEIGASNELTNSEIAESSTNPLFTRQDSLKAFQFRIRNLPYSIDNYDLTIDEQQRLIIVKTKNKKYFKKISIPDLDRVQENFDSNKLTFTHANNTLIISYEKSKDIQAMEKAIWSELSKMKATKDGDVDCKPS